MTPCSVFILQDKHEPLMKVGISVNIAARANGLEQDIDWSRSCHAVLLSETIARCVEKLLHALLTELLGLRPRPVPPARRRSEGILFPTCRQSGRRQRPPSPLWRHASRRAMARRQVRGRRRP